VDGIRSGDDVLLSAPPYEDLHDLCESFGRAEVRFVILSSDVAESDRFHFPSASFVRVVIHEMRKEGPL
jgi:hypothetical protein